MSFLLLHWNARSLIANGQEFKKHITEMGKVPDIICIQETWLNSSLDFKINGYVVERKDRETGRCGGCATFIKEGIAYKRIHKSNNVECVSIEVMGIDEEIRITNLYNPCKEISSLFSNISNRPVSVVDLLGKGLNYNQVFKAVLTFLELTGLDHRI